MQLRVAQSLATQLREHRLVRGFKGSTLASGVADARSLQETLMAGTSRNKAAGDDAPGSFWEFVWRLLADQIRLSNLAKLAKTAVGLICSLLICLGAVACGIVFVLGKAGAKGSLPELLSAGLVVSVSLIGGTIRVRKRLTRRPRALGDGGDHRSFLCWSWAQVVAVATTERVCGCRQACS
jgi:hypothetical protein